MKRTKKALAGFIIAAPVAAFLAAQGTRPVRDDVW